jgi:hypothetical protein
MYMCLCKGLKESYFINLLMMYRLTEAATGG